MQNNHKLAKKYKKMQESYKFTLLIFYITFIYFTIFEHFYETVKKVTR